MPILRTDDLAAFKVYLEEKGIAYSDWGETAVAGWQQISSMTWMAISSKTMKSRAKGTVMHH